MENGAGTETPQGTAISETQPVVQPPVETPAVTTQTPTVEHAGFIRRILNRFLNPMGKPKPTEMPTVSDSQTETPPPLTASQAARPPLSQPPPNAS